MSGRYSPRLPKCPDLGCRALGLSVGAKRSMCLGLAKYGLEDYSLCLFDTEGGELLRVRLNKTDIAVLKAMLGRI
jgi:hypothetical protein